MEEKKKRIQLIDKVKHPVLYEIADWVRVILVAGCIAALINSLIIANSTVPTGSMENTIMPGSRVFGLRLSYTFGEVKRNDVAIFLYGYKCSNEKKMYRETKEHVCPGCGRKDSMNARVYYVKRVIGMPGDHIEIKFSGYREAEAFQNIKIGPKSDGSMPEVPVGTLYVNGTPVEETYLPEPMIVDGNRYPEIDVTVPAGHYYMLGDNRNNSADARFWGENNFVAEERMIAPVYVKYWPLNEIGMIN